MAGAKLVLAGRRQERLDELKSELKVPVHTLVLDVRERAAVEKAIAGLAADFAEQIHWIASVPPHVSINTLEIMPVTQSWAGFAVHRE